MAYGTALTYGANRRRRPGGGALYVEDEITAQASRLPALYAMKKSEERADASEALEKKALAKTEEFATLDRASTERISEREAQLREAQIASNEAIASRSEALQREQQQSARRQDRYGNIISGVGLGLSALDLIQDAGGFGGIADSIMGLWNDIF